jgi:hypothetical protein
MPIGDEDYEPTIPEIVEWYIQQVESNYSEEYFWAWVEMDETAHDDPERCWEIILAILKEAPSKYVLFSVAAGPLEDLLKHHGDTYIDKIKSEAKHNERLLFALTEVMFEPDTKAFVEVEKLLENYDPNQFKLKER